MATALTLLTAEEFARLPEDGQRLELVRGVVVPMNMPRFRHGEVCSNIDFILNSYIRPRHLGRTTTNDSGVVVERDPDTVRGPDVAYFSYARLPKEIQVELYPPVAPDLAVEVKSPDDRWPEIHRKVGEYLTAGVTVVCVVDYEERTVSLFYADKPAKTLPESDDLTLPEVLGDFRVPIRELFE